MEEKYNYLKPFEKVTLKKENGVWYFNYPEWVLSKASLSMVRGSDILLDILAKEDKNELTMMAKARVSYWREARFSYSTFPMERITG